MVNLGRRLSVNIRTFMQKANMSPEIFAEKMGYSIRDTWRVLEGKVVLSPLELSRISSVIGTTKEDLLSYETDYQTPELQYMKEFSNPNNLDMILDLMDEYVECRECI